MFDENGNLVTDVTENVEQQTTEENVEVGEVVETTEQNDVGVETEKSLEEAIETFTKEQVDEMIAKKLARREARIRKEYDKKYSRLETVVNAGLGTNSIEESTSKLEEFYKEKGIDIPNIPSLSEDQAERLALLDADDVIESGYDDVKEEVDRLTELGIENMSSAEKKYFLKLANHRQNVETENEFRSVGISKEEMDTKEFKNIMNSLNPNLTAKEKLDIYLKLKPKKETKKIGSVKSGMTSQVKDFYTPEEIERLTDEDLDKPGVWEAVRKSMTGQ